MAEKMTPERLRSLFDAAMDDGMGSPRHEISLERAKAWDYYMSKPLGNEVEGQSKVVSSDVADVVDGIMPSLLRIFTTADNAVDFDAVGVEDEAGAAQESDYVNYVFFKQNPSVWIMFCWFFDALVQKNGIVKCYWDESERVTQETYKGLSDDELAELLSDDEVEVVEHTERQAETVATVEVEIQPGKVAELQTVEPGTVHDIVLKRLSKRGRVRVEPVPPEEYRISADARSLDPSEARAVGHERTMTRSELIELGFDKKEIEALAAVEDAETTPEKIARRDKTDDFDDQPHDKSQDRILVRSGFMKVDFDGDGVSELREIWTAGNKLLSNEVADRQNFHVLTPHPLPHKHFGRSSAEKVMDIQEVNSTLWRQILDNLYHTNRPSHAVWEQGIGENTLEDLLTTRIGSIKRFRRPVQESYQPITVPFTAAATFPMLEYQEKVKRDRTGISSDAEGLNPEALKNIQQSVMGHALDLSRMKIEMIARIFAETGIKSLFRHIHELLQKHQDKPKVVKLRGKWIQVNPQEWRTREDMTVKVGLGIGTREQNLLHLNAIWEKQAQIVQNGGADILVTGSNLFNTASEFVKNANLKDPELFFTNPGDKPLAQPSGEALQLQRQQLELQQRQQQLDAERQAVNAAKIELQAQKQQIEAQKERARLGLDAAELERKRQADQDKLSVEFEKIRNQLTEFELKYATNVPGSKV